HQTKNHSQISSSVHSRIFCKLCPKKSYKSQAGLSRHETIVHSHYNIPQTRLIPQLPEAIIEFKNILVHMIQTKLKPAHNNRGWYQCIFTGIGAYECLEQILNDEKWVREYENKQQIW
ncbi:898_t:CDS:2, partial [Racocetra persica]